MRILVKCVLFVEVEIPDDRDPEFVLVENGCPGTGVVFPALRALIEEQEESDTCVMCARGCVNAVDRILEKGKPQ